MGCRFDLNKGKRWKIDAERFEEKSAENRRFSALFGTLGAIRTRGLSLRRRTLYPAELRGLMLNCVWAARCLSPRRAVVRDFRRRVLHPAELRGRMRFHGRFHARKRYSTPLPGKKQGVFPSSIPPERYRISDIPFPARSGGSDGPAPAAALRPAAAPPPRPPRPAPASRERVPPS